MKSTNFSQSQFMRQLANNGLERPSWCDGGNEQRNAPREPVVIDAVVRQAKLEPVGVTVLNFSRVGCAFACAKGFRDNESFFLHLEGLEPLRASVVWKREMRYGCKFDKPIYEAVAQHITARLSRKDQRRDHEKRVTMIRSAISR